ncbi:hypothetical protein EXIGLDRAFT_776755 [Exidia glandulosa HHB12029]|uniref:F-box domain-containing protein n=1 Tax=Exidia glandulosa HHB12029 TaxID=1314781 RepID=A0A165DCA1_EXIGL|nr:hypothetical protein EXIGLDRAFT_776755 [Exidia glandulosa HHB12029]
MALTLDPSLRDADVTYSIDPALTGNAVLTLDPASRLPPELVTSVLDYLGQPEVLRAARISPRWRAIATRHRSFYAHLVLDDYAQASHFDAFCSDVAYVVERNVHIGLHVVLDSVNRIYPKTWDDGAVQVARSLLQACPFIVRFKLFIDCLGRLADALDDLLQQPFPMLKELTLMRRSNDWHDQLLLPASFLSGHTSRLSKLALRGYCFPPSSAGVAYSFPRLRTLALDDSRCALSDVAARFPDLAELSCSGTEFIPTDSVGFHRLFPRLKHLDVQPCPISPLPWTNTEQTARIASLSVQLRVQTHPHTEFEESPLPFVRCIQAPARLEFFQSGSAQSAGAKPKMHICIKGGGFTRTFVHERVTNNSPPIKGLVAHLGERITHICINWQCLNYFALSTWPHGPALRAVRRMEVDLTDIARGNDHLFNYDMHRRHATTTDAELDEFDMHVEHLGVPVPQNPYETTLIEFVLSSRTEGPIWFPAHRLLGLARQLGLHLVQQMTLVLAHGIVIEPEDVELLLLVFVDVQYGCTCTDCINR